MKAEDHARIVAMLTEIAEDFEQLHAEDPTAVIRVQHEFEPATYDGGRWFTDSEPFNGLAGWSMGLLESLELAHRSEDVESSISAFVRFVRETVPFDGPQISVEPPGNANDDFKYPTITDGLPSGAFLHAALAIRIVTTKFQTMFSADQCRLRRLLANLPSKFHETMKLLWEGGSLIYWEITAVRSVWPIVDGLDPHKDVKAFLNDMAAHVIRDAPDSGVSVVLYESGVRLDKRNTESIG
jgi:hypothetical protein